MTPGAPGSLLRRPCRVLALSGGGFLGLYTARVLQVLEGRTGAPLGRSFDLIGGTSIGGVLALALAFEIPMSRLVQLFESAGPRIFSHRALPSGTVSRLMDLTRSVTGPKYNGAELRVALEHELGDARLGEAKHPLVVPAVDVDACTTKVFKTPHAAASRGDAECRAVDVAMAACAAPAYFPLARVGERLYADGGLFAVAPDQIVLHELQHFMGIEPARVSMLSVGTATAGYRPEDGVDEQAGAVGWLSEGRLILTLIAVQQQHVQAMMEDRLGQRYLRLDATWPQGARLGIDVATPDAAHILIALAEDTLRQAPVDRLAAYLARRDQPTADG
jgi:uncharacterized protein